MLKQSRYNDADGASRFLSPEAFALFDGRPGALALYGAFARALLAAHPDAEVRAAKTQISFYGRRMFACASLSPVRPKALRPEPYLTVSFGLPRALESPRALAVPVRPNRWTHHVLIGRAEEIDGELMGWVAEARAFAER